METDDRIGWCFLCRSLVPFESCKSLRVAFLSCDTEPNMLGKSDISPSVKLDSLQHTRTHALSVGQKLLWVTHDKNVCQTRSLNKPNFPLPCRGNLAFVRLHAAGIWVRMSGTVTVTFGAVTHCLWRKPTCFQWGSLIFDLLFELVFEDCPVQKIKMSKMRVKMTRLCVILFEGISAPHDSSSVEITT